MTQTQLIERFLEGVEPGIDLTTGKMGATHNRMRWIVKDDSGPGRALAYRGGESVIVFRDNAPKSLRSIARSREDLVTRRCLDRGIRLGIWAPLLPMPGRKELGLRPLMLRGLGIVPVETGKEFDPLFVHLTFGKVLLYQTNHGLWWNTYTAACDILALEPLFPSAGELVDWYAAASQIL